MPVLLEEISAPHIVGVGGAGMSAIATVLVGMGKHVSGSDLKDSSITKRLVSEGVSFTRGHDASNIPQAADVVVISSAVHADNPEVVEAKRRGIPVLSRADALAAIVAGKHTICVSGSDGKTTTSAMLAAILYHAKKHPSFLIGGELLEFGTNAAVGTGEYMVVEADESDGTFLELPGQAAIITNIVPDHLGHYGSFAALLHAFDEFVAKVPGPKLLGADNEHNKRLADTYGTSTFGFHAEATYHITNYEPTSTGARCVLAFGGTVLGEVVIPVPGRHNAQNACAAIAMAVELGVPFKSAAKALTKYRGVARRFQFRGEVNGISFVDDYAHLPGEVVAAIQAAREGSWNRVIVAFQPHRYTRTVTLWRQFCDAFVDADELILTDIYSAGETPIPNVSGDLLVRAVLDAHPEQRLGYFPSLEDVALAIRRVARPGDLVLTLGAGDLTTLPDVVMAQLEEAA